MSVESKNVHTLKYQISVDVDVDQVFSKYCYLVTLLPNARRKSCKMFKKFEEKDSISSIQQLKSSVQKGIRAKLLEAYPKLETHIDLILPKKDSYRIAKCHDHIELLLNGAGEQVFFRHRDCPWMPTLRLLHKFPYFVTMQQVDKGAIRFVLSGANVMCPGLTSPGACMTPADKNTVVAIMAEGKEHALAIGLLTLSTEEILAKKKGIGIETYHFLNDGLWKSKPVK